MRWKKVTLVGVGLLGGSLGLALRRRKLAQSVFGLVRRVESVRDCERAGAVNQATMDLAEAVNGAELVVLCTPIARMLPMLREILPLLSKGTIITDVGSVKGRVVKDLEGACKMFGCHFVGSHPMAGAEKMGVNAARENLFENAVCVVTPTRKSNLKAVKRVTGLWEAVGCRVLSLSPEAHDQLVSRSSHLPHVVAGALVRLVLNDGAPPEQGMLCATGFRDTTRIASGSPEMWRDIAVSNGKNLAAALGALIKELERVRKKIAKGDERKIEKFFVRAKELRDQWRNGCETPGEVSQGSAAKPLPSSEIKQRRGRVK